MILHYDEPPTQCYFSIVWRECFKSIKVRKLSRFSKCSVSDDLRAALRKEVLQGVIPWDLKLRKMAHNHLGAHERRYYMKKRKCDSSIIVILFHHRVWCWSVRNWTSEFYYIHKRGPCTLVEGEPCRRFISFHTKPTANFHIVRRVLNWCKPCCWSSSSFFGR